MLLHSGGYTIEVESDSDEERGDSDGERVNLVANAGDIIVVTAITKNRIVIL